MSYPQNSGSPFPPQQPSFADPASSPTPYGAYGGPGHPNEPPKSSSGTGCLTAFLIGLLAFFLVVVLICGVGGFVLYRASNEIAKSAKGLAADFAHSVAVSVIKESELSEEDKQAVVVQLDRVVDAYKRGEIDEASVQRIMNEIQTSPLLPLAHVYNFEKRYLEMSGLTAEEKADARLQLQRLLRGGMDKKIAQRHIDGLMGQLEEKDDFDKVQPKEKMTDEEIRNFISDAKKLADEAMIPNEEFKVDVGDEVRRIVDVGLGVERDP